MQKTKFPLQPRTELMKKSKYYHTIPTFLGAGQYCADCIGLYLSVRQCTELYSKVLLYGRGLYFYVVQFTVLYCNLSSVTPDVQEMHCTEIYNVTICTVLYLLLRHAGCTGQVGGLLVRDHWFTVLGAHLKPKPLRRVLANFRSFLAKTVFLECSKLVINLFFLFNTLV